MKKCKICGAKEINKKQNLNIPLPKEFDDVFNIEIPIIEIIKNYEGLFKNKKVEICQGCINYMMANAKIPYSNEELIEYDTFEEKERKLIITFNKNEILNR